MSEQATTTELFEMWQRSMTQGLEAWQRLLTPPAGDKAGPWAPLVGAATEAWARAIPQDGNPIEALAQWKKFLDESVEAWSQVMARSMETEAFATLMGGMLSQYLDAVAPLRQAIRSTSEEALRAANLPSRAQITSLASQIVAIDARLETLEERLDELIGRLSSLDGAARQAPAATGAAPAPGGREPRGPRAKRRGPRDA